MDGLGQALLVLAIAAAAGVVAVRLGMLVAPHLDRLTAPDDEGDEDDGGHDD